jgi:hypothetical protein
MSWLSDMQVMLDNYEVYLEFPQPVWSVSRVWQPLSVAVWYVSLALYGQLLHHSVGERQPHIVHVNVPTTT